MDRFKIGIAMLAGAALLAILAILVFWGGISRWLTHAALGEHHQARFMRPDTPTPYMRDPANHRGDDLRRVLPGMDLTDPSAAERLERLVRSADTHHERRLAQAAARFAAILDGTDPGADHSGGDPDQKLLDHLVAMRQATMAPLPTWPELPSGTAPQQAILRRTLEEQVRAGWRLGDAVAAVEAAARLDLIHPRHPAIRWLRTLHHTLGTGASRSTIHNALAGGAKRDDAIFLRQLLNLARHDPRPLAASRERQREVLGELAATIARVIPSKHRSAEEEAAELIAGKDLEAMLKRLGDDSSPAFITAVAMRAHHAGDWRAVRDLLPRVLPSHRPGLELALALHEMDLAALKKLVPDLPTRQRVVPQLANTRLGFESVSFQLTDATDTFPAGQVDVLINQTPIEPTRIARFGPLFEVPTPPGSMQVRLTIRVGSQTIAERIVHK